MLRKKLLVSVMIAAGTLGVVATPPPSVAASNVEIYVNSAPPPPRYEAVPAPRRGYVWAPGHWRWSDDRYRHVWVPGHWERARPGYAYQAPGWVERDGRWRYQPSRWDRDGDGIPNRRDLVAARGAAHAVDFDTWLAGPGGAPFHSRMEAGDATARAEAIRAWQASGAAAPGSVRTRDRDGDGVPDRRDNYPNNPNRR